MLIQHLNFVSIIKGSAPSRHILFLRPSPAMVEAIEHPSKPYIFTVQWHPESQPASRISRRLFRAFVRSCSEYQTRKNS